MPVPLRQPVVYFARRIETFRREGLPDPPRHLRETIRCDTCQEKCFANKENLEKAKRASIIRVTCEVCYALGRHRTG
jgi:hypothetical protein